MEFLKKIKNREAQGATEYLLMLAAVLVIVAVAVYFVMGTSVSFMVTPATGYPQTTDTGDVIFVADTVTPDNVTADTVAVYNPGDSSPIGEETNVQIESGKTVTVTTGDDEVESGAELRITYGGNTKIFDISVS